jgi:cbb3-type cytochrome c oxidase subunit III
MMKIGGLHSALRTAILAAALSACLAIVSHADDFQAKVTYCKTCHGLSGQGYHGYYPMPRLAGQQPKYIENQLRAFIEHRRKNQIMANVAHVLSPSMVSELAHYFRDLNSPPLGGGGSSSAIAMGKRIYDEGLPESNVPACSACHGQDAKGQDQIPRLAGQLPDYFYSKLVNWAAERGQNSSMPDSSAVMGPTAHNLTKSQIAAVAAYVSSLR